MSYSETQRLAFGTVATLYDRVRPSYPTVVIDAIIEAAGLRPGTRILEVGAGTGKATLGLAQRGLEVVALEPSAEMAAVLRANCAGRPGVEVVEAPFERWAPTRRFPTLVSAAAWHWIDPGVRCRRAHDALAPGATLAAIWTLPEWRDCPLRPALSDAYRETVPEMRPDFPMHPDSSPSRLADGWGSEILASGLFEGPEVRSHRWSIGYTGSAYADVLRTHQDHILLECDARTRLLAAVAAVIADAGGRLELPTVTRLCLATRRS